MMDTPRALIPFKPDWQAGEVINARRTDYYESTRAIGHLFRAINLQNSAKELTFDGQILDLKNKSEVSLRPVVDAISFTLQPIVETRMQSLPADLVARTIPALFARYWI